MAVVLNLGISQHLFALGDHCLLVSVALQHLQVIAQMIFRVRRELQKPTDVLNFKNIMDWSLEVLWAPVCLASLHPSCLRPWNPYKGDWILY